ncbi:MAG: hypothetical protein ACP5OU_00570 [Methanothrix sp.]
MRINLIFSLISIAFIFIFSHNIGVGDAQSGNNTTIYEGLVSGTSYTLDLGELSSCEGFLISVKSDSLAPWGLRIFKSLSYGQPINIKSQWDTGSLISWHPGNQRYINVSDVSGNTTGPGHYYLELSTKEGAGASLTKGALQIDIGGFGFPTEWYLLVKKYTDENKKFKSIQSLTENITDNTTEADSLYRGDYRGIKPVSMAQLISGRRSQSSTRKDAENTTYVVRAIEISFEDNASDVEPVDDYVQSQSNTTENATDVVRAIEISFEDNASDVKPTDDYALAQQML